MSDKSFWYLEESLAAEDYFCGGDLTAIGADSGFLCRDSTTISGKLTPFYFNA